MPSLRSFVVLQLLLTAFLAALLWSLQQRASKGESFHHWAWTSVLIICLGLVLVLLDRYQQAKGALSLNVLHRRRITAENLAFQAELDERIKVERALRESESRYRAVVEDQSELICRFGAGAIITFVNDAYCRYFGRTKEDLLGRSFMELIPEAEHERLRRHLGSFTPHRPRGVTEHQVTSATGEIRWQQWTDHALFDDHGLAEFQSVGRDITERKQAEEALREGEERLRALVSASVDVIWRTDAAGEVLFVSPSWEDLTGQTAEQMRNLGWLDAVHPDDRARPLAVWAEAAAAKRSYESEMRVRTRDGHYRHFQTRGVPIFAEDGGIREWIGTNTDITARKEAESALRESQLRYQLATAAGGVGVWDLDVESGSMYIDPHLKAMLGFEDHEIRNHLDDWLQHHDPADVGRVIADAAAYAAGSAVDYEDEHRMVHKDGSIRWFLARGRLVGGPGERRRLVGTDTDVTARKEAENEARELREELAHVGRVTSLGALTGSLAHEINQPLASIMANGQAALRMIAAPQLDLAELRETLCDIVSDDRRAGEVLRRLRALLTKEAPETKPLDIKSTVEEILQLVHSDVVMRRVALEVDFAPGLPPVQGDRVQLQQVALNLLINAFEAVQDLDLERRRVVLQAGRQDGHVVLSVVDHGRGVPADQMARMFEPFYTTKPDGMGLGLAICQTIAASHGGALVAVRNAGPGMTFSLRLPVAPAAAS